MMMEEERRRRAEYERRKRIEEELRRREMEEMQRQRMAMEQARARRSRRAKEQPYATYPPSTIVHGADGRLYRVVTPPREEGSDVNESSYSDAIQDRSPSASSEEDKENTIDAADVEMKHKMRLKSNSSGSLSRMESDLKTNKNEKNDTVGHVGRDAPEEKRSDVPLHQIVVENVPDEEDDELREMRSVWRNRTPSPGQWMEPVESFVG